MVISSGDPEVEKELYVLVGLPRSGKSTWAQQQSVPIVCPDAIRLALTGQAFVPEAEPMVWTLARYMVRALFLAGHRHVILDACNTTKARRSNWKSPEWQRTFLWFDTPAGTCQERAGENVALHSAIVRMDEEFALPAEGE